jgi:C4-dicarboxylate-specific signal transduction histidine kinase
LIQNAIVDYTTDRDRVLRVRTGLHNRDAIIVTVEDSGPGIDSKQLGSIFDAFFTTKSYGIGLGLAICRMIVERHGGQLSAASDGNNGAQFQFVLPTMYSASANSPKLTD